VLDALPQAVFWKDQRSTYLGCNRLFAQHAGIETPDRVVGRTDFDMPWKREDIPGYHEDDRQVITTRQAKLGIVESQRLSDGAETWVETNKIPLLDERGHVMGVVGTYADITERKRAEQAVLRQREQIIATQSALLEELSTPLIPIQEGVVVMPLIGTFDQGRSRRVMEILLDGIIAHKAQSVILDLTGMPHVNTGVAAALVAAARAARLLGAEVMLTGMRPELAQTLAELEIALDDVRTFGTLQDGIAHAMR